jgi:hypothetical protein
MHRRLSKLVYRIDVPKFWPNAPGFLALAMQAAR